MPSGGNDNRVDRSVSKEAVRALVEMLGPREAARQSGVPTGTVFTWCARYGWRKKGFVAPTTGKNLDKAQSAFRQVMAAMERYREKSAFNLAKFVEKASKEAARSKEPLKNAKLVRDVAATFGVVWPNNQETVLIQGAILIGEAKVTDNLEEMKEATIVREELPGKRPEGD